MKQDPRQRAFPTCLRCLALALVGAALALEAISPGTSTVEGPVGRVYSIESAGDLNPPISWEVRTNFALTTSPQTWTDPATVITQRFYRAVLLP